MASFTVEKLWTLISSPLFIFAFLALVAEREIKKKNAKTDFKEFTVYFFNQSFMFQVLYFSL